MFNGVGLQQLHLQTCATRTTYLLKRYQEPRESYPKICGSFKSLHCAQLLHRLILLSRGFRQSVELEVRMELLNSAYLLESYDFSHPA